MNLQIGRFSAVFLVVSTLILGSGCGGLSSGEVLKIPQLSSAVGGGSSVETSAISSARFSSPQFAISPATSGGALIHASAKTANEVEFDIVNSDIKYAYRHALGFFKFARGIDTQSCIINALKDAGLIEFNGEYAYVKIPSGDVIRLKVSTNDGAIESYEMAACSGSTQKLFIKSDIEAAIATGSLKYVNGGESAILTFLGRLDEEGGWDSKLLDMAYVTGATGSDTAMRINMIQTAQSMQINGVNVDPTTLASTPALASSGGACFTKFNLYGSAYSSGSTGYGFGAGSLKASGTISWDDDSASDTTSSHITDVSNAALLTVASFNDLFAKVPFDEEDGEVWDCTTSGTVVDLTDSATLAQVTDAVTACNP